MVRRRSDDPAFSPLPEWLHHLAVEGADSPTGIFWYPPDERSQRTKVQLGRLTSHRTDEDPLLREERLTPYICVGEILSTTTLAPPLGGTFWLDVTTPGHLLCALNAAYPPDLWIPVGHTLSVLFATLAPYFPMSTAPTPDPFLHALQQRRQRQAPASARKTVRLLLGLVEDFAHLENTFVFAAPFVTPFTTLGTAQPFAHDPIQFTTMVTVNSRTEIVLEHHQWLPFGGDMHAVVAQLTYPSTTEALVVNAFNARHASDYPEDLPVDALAALRRFPMKGLQRIRHIFQTAESTEELQDMLPLLAVVEADDEQFREDLRSALTSPDVTVRRMVAALAQARHFTDLLQAMYVQETDAPLRQALADWLGGMAM